MECECGTISKVSSIAVRHPWFISCSGLQETESGSTPMLDNRTEGHAYAQLEYASSVQKCGVFSERPLID